MKSELEMDLIAWRDGSSIMKVNQGLNVPEYKYPSVRLHYSNGVLCGRFVSRSPTASLLSNVVLDQIGFTRS